MNGNKLYEQKILFWKSLGQINENGIKRQEQRITGSQVDGQCPKLNLVGPNKPEYFLDLKHGNIYFYNKLLYLFKLVI